MEPPLRPVQTNEPPGPPASPELSEREVEVLRLVATGVGNKQIAQQLSISPNTVKVHLRNIFAKIGATSRTEAAMYAAREGLVALPPSAVPEAGTPVASSAPELAARTENGAAPAPNSTIQRWLRLRWAAAALLALIMLTAGGAWVAVQFRPTPLPPPTAVALRTASPAPPRWQALADMSTARSGLAAVAYDDHIYAIAGESAQGVTGLAERYSPPTNSWETLAAKPVPVTDVSAAVIGGRIYVPGGQLASGQMTTTVEAYSPRDNRWQTLAPLPAPVSAYAMVAFEGQLYVFGGWDGKVYRANVYRYDPQTDTWTELTPMPTARGNAGAAAAGGRIYVIGGTGTAGPMAVNEVYSPEQETPGDSPWQTRAPLPGARPQLQAANIADNIYVASSAGGAGLLAFGYLPSANTWQTVQPPPDAKWAGAALVALDNSLHLLGGKDSAAPLARHLSYQALYTVFIPVVR
ncbi:MAG: LuxR C-terminal-related transcriptional regulator [Methanothrix sp.]|nr:LuxR C-terminal-related transcriptional regulator [Methanothrix sp.]